jgi:DegV family protein with EDD domain
MTVKIVIDSTTDIPPETIRSLGLHVVPLSVIFGNDSYLDGVEMQAPEFYRRLTTENVFPTTSQPSPGSFEEKYREVLETSDGVVSIHLASKLSGTYASAIQAKSQMGSDGEAIRVVDSQTASMATGLIVLAAAEAAERGASVDEVAAVAESTVERTGVVFLLDTMEYLKRGGRIGSARAFLGSLLRFRPLLTIEYGVVKPLARPRSRRAGIKRLRALIEEAGEIESAAIISSLDQEGAAALAEEISDLVPSDISTGHTIGPVLGAHCGSGVIGIAYVRAS